jgi:hypothetical protein
MRLFKMCGVNSRFVQSSEVNAVKLAKQSKNKKVEITYTDAFISKIKGMIGVDGSDKKIIEEFIKKLTIDK